MSALAYALTALGGLGAAGLGLAGWLGHAWSVELLWLVPLAGLALRMDPLAGFFLFLVGATSVPASIYAIGYMRGARRGLGAYAVFLLGMAVVPLAANVPTFLIAWELMALASYALVLHDREDAAAVRAAWIYAVMTHAGLACLLAGMLLMFAWTGSLVFADWRAASATLDAPARNVVFVLLALGFASKAGMIPLHVWLPAAHPAAPSHVSALMSGVMIKLGVMGLLRAGMEWLGVGPPWWGVALLLAGALSALAGVLYAAVEGDLKRLLAFSSIDNVGIILIAAGAGMVFHAAGLETLAVFALAAGLYHTVNHAAFKALLFLGAGAVARGAGTRDLEAMGGLIKRMPWTAAAFLVGALAIAALPPLNGFVSEWLTFQALLQNGLIPRPELNLVFVLALAGLALTGGLAVACFVRAFGIAFLALPRSEGATNAHEAGPAMRAGMGLLVIACVGLALLPTVLLPRLGAAAARLLGDPAPALRHDLLTIAVSGDFATLSMPVVAGALTLGLALLPLLLRLARAPRAVRWSETWGCGRLLQTARMEYTAIAFASPLRRIFDFLYRAEKRLEVEAHPESRFFVRRMAYRNAPRALAEEWLYAPLLIALRAGADRVRAIQSGSANLYLIYVLAALLVLLVLA
ncbi:MAG TPA: proton-conducting transporter membrane subunit [Methylomirabilota bacterium]|nr:proton-conducting transporter membrane subunit [Methylomirabilota bacterium]